MYLDNNRPFKKTPEKRST